MKKGIALILATAATGIIAAPAMAQDNSTFTGPRVEILGGYDVSKAGDTVDNDANENDDQSIDGFAYGAGVGYDFSMGGAVVGVEGEWMDSTAKTEYDMGDFENIGLPGRLDAGRDLYVGVRAGILATPSTLVYAKGGYTNAKYNALALDGETEFKRDVNTDGYRIGAGVEQAIGTNAFAKLEYRYSNYSSAEIDFSGDNNTTQPFDVDTDRHQVVAGVGWRF